MALDSITNWTKGEKKKGTSIGTNTKKIEPRDDQKSSTGPVVASRWIHMWIIGPETL